ncbi:hypothetical protein, partial [Prochlorococcus marinus]|uniref:hypothetical protein n=1 Tax=Prochlorococcus marinus TaxID=1219 RepID=UPI0035A7146F|nr:hypothetical protein [Prochlorococcus marinus str. XMU1408]
MKGFDTSKNLQRDKHNRKEKKTSVVYEELIKKAVEYHSQGKLKEASKYYQLILDKGLQNPIVLSNYGAILQH